MALTWEVIFPLSTTVISLMFTLSLLEQYYRKRKPHQFVWFIAMVLFTVTAGAEGLSLLLGHWNPFVYRLYYVLAAVQVSFMGAGVLYLLAVRNVINETNLHRAILLFGTIWLFFSYIFTTIDAIFLYILVPAILMELFGIIYWINVRLSDKLALQNKIRGIHFAHLFIFFSVYIFVIMTIKAFTTPVNMELLRTGGQVSGLAWQQNSSDPTEPRAAIRLFSPLHTVPGGVALIGGAFFSYIMWQLSLKKQTGKFSWKQGFFNIYIGIGALVLAWGAFLSGFGLGTLYISEVISVTLMYFGFLESDKISAKKLINTLTLQWLWRKEPVKMP